MEIARYLTLLAVMGLDLVFADGHKKKHHDHLKIHVPEFIHHDFHTKVITIHHHHHKPKKEHHHHHHHHHHKPKPHVPHHHVHKKKTVKTHTTTTKKSHGHHGHHGHHHHHKHHGHHHKHHGHHHKHHGHHHKHHGHHHKHHGHHHGHHHHDPFSYDPTPVSYDTSPASYDSAQDSYEDHFEPSYSPPTFDSGIPEDIPKVHGFTHTVKQLQVFDSHQNEDGSPSGPGGGYQVTEAGEDEDDPFNSENTLQHSYPGTLNFVKHLAPEEPIQDPFASLTVQSTVPSEVQFQSSPQPASNFGIETFNTAGAISEHEAQQYASAGPTQSAGLEHPSQEFATGFDGDDGGINDAETFSAPGASYIPSAYFTNKEHQITDEGPTSFSRTAGIQQSYLTGGQQSIVY